MTTKLFKRAPMSSLSRRQLLAGSASLGLAALVAGVWRTPAPLPRELFISAEGDQINTEGLGLIDTQAQQAQTLGSAFRGHGSAQNPAHKHIALMFARHPGDQGIEVDLLQRQITRRFSCGASRYFEGHGCYSADGHWFFTSETNRLSSEGVIGVYSARSLQKMAEFSSYGIEPHELKLMPDGKTLVVANGGLRYASPSDRTPMNAATMASNLSYIDSQSGNLIEQVSLLDASNRGDFQLDHLATASLRHVDVAPDGRVAIAMQVQRSAINNATVTGNTATNNIATYSTATNNTVLPLSALHQQGQGLQLLPEPQAVIRQLDDYMGSVAINAAAGLAGFTSPRGNLAVFWQLASGQFAGYHRFHDVCGIAVSRDQQHFVLSNSTGQLRHLNAHSLQEDKTLRLQFDGRRWDNHLSSITT